MVELHLDRLPPGRSSLELDHELVREDQVYQGHRIEGFTARVRGSLDVDNLDQKVLVHGEFSAIRMMVCDRSGEPFELEYPVDIEILVYRRGQKDSDDGEVGEGDNWVIQQPGGRVDLTEALLEAVVLEQPQHVVHPDHEGDPLPGAVTEDRPADGGTSEEIDPRWEALRRLQEEGSDSKDAEE